VVPADEIEDGQLVIYGRHKTKSPNNAYVLTDDARRLIVELPDDEYEAQRDEWLSADNQRRLRLLQKETADLTISSDHSDLIDAMWVAMSRRKCADYERVFIDDNDDDRISDRWRPRLEELGLLLDLDSVWPDLMAVKAGEKKIWFFDAVVSDGEIDEDRRDQMLEWAAARGWTVAGMTTGYLTWAAAAARQGQHSNLAVGTSLWIAKDGGKFIPPLESLVE